MSKTNRKSAIGVFDSGLGGLTVVKQLIKALPNEDIVYFGDTARVPYGTKSKDAIIQFSKENTAQLVKHDVKVVVVACTSSSSYALTELKKNFDVPFVGVIGPGVRKALEQTRNQRVGVIATSATVQSGAYETKLRGADSRVKVFSKECPLFVPLVEEGWSAKAVTENIAREYLKPLKAKKIDTLILGCTHYPLLKPVLRKVLGSSVSLVDSSKAVAESVKDLLNEKELLSPSKKQGRLKFLVSHRPQSFQRIAKRFLGFEIKSVKVK